MVGLSNNAVDALTTTFAAPLKAMIQRISMAEEIERFSDPERIKKPLLRWGKDCIGIGLLKALREKRSIVFTDEPSPVEAVSSKSGRQRAACVIKSAQR
jgi:hypothetical protein